MSIDLCDTGPINVFLMLRFDSVLFSW